jgi:hypothetical protein
VLEYQLEPQSRLCRLTLLGLDSRVFYHLLTTKSRECYSESNSGPSEEMRGKMARYAKFADMLTIAVRTIAAREHKTIACVQDELGYALGRDSGGSCIEYWRKGHVPADLSEVEKLAQELLRREGLQLREGEQFLQSAGHPHPKDVLSELLLLVGRDLPVAEKLHWELSPFVAGPPVTVPRQFFGRERELEYIFGLWRRFPLQNVTVIGPKRSGKTSLLHYLSKITRTAQAELRPGQRTGWLPQPDRYRWVFIDFQDVRMGSRDRLLRHILTGLGMPVPDLCNLDLFMDIVSHHLQTPAVILMDEIGAGLASSELDEPFWWSLRSLASNNTDGYLAFLLTAHAPPAQLAEGQGKPSPFFNIFHTLELGPLTDGEAQMLIRSAPQPFSARDADWILRQSGRWPCLLQILCQARLTALELGEAGDRWQEEGLRQIAPFRYLLER